MISDIFIHFAIKDDCICNCFFKFLFSQSKVFIILNNLFEYFYEKRDNAMSSTPTTYEILIAGSISGMSSVMICHPFDTIRTRLQASPGRFPTLRPCLTWTLKHEGIRGLYKGFAPPFWSQAVYKSVIFMISTSMRKRLHEQGYTARWVTLFSGALAGACNGIIVSPVELVRNQLQVQYHTDKRPSSIGLVRSIYNKHGFRGLFRGLPVTMFRDGIGVAFYFAGFEGCKSLMTTDENIDDKDKTSTLLVSGAVGGLSFWLVALPFDTLKTRIQIDTEHHRKPILAYANNIWKQYGWKGFFHGWQVAFTRGIPSAAITFWSYYRAMEFLQES